VRQLAGWSARAEPTFDFALMTALLIPLQAGTLLASACVWAALSLAHAVRVAYSNHAPTDQRQKIDDALAKIARPG